MHAVYTAALRPYEGNSYEESNTAALAATGHAYLSLPPRFLTGAGCCTRRAFGIKSIRAVRENLGRELELIGRRQCLHIWERCSCKSGDSYLQTVLYTYLFVRARGRNTSLW